MLPNDSDAPLAISGIYPEVVNREISHLREYQVVSMSVGCRDPDRECHSIPALILAGGGFLICHELSMAENPLHFFHNPSNIRVIVQGRQCPEALPRIRLASRQGLL